MLQPSQTLEIALNRIPCNPDSSRPTFNQTNYDSIVESPLAISIETKPFNTIKLEDGRCQLSMWAAAQFRKTQLLRDSAPPPSSPTPSRLPQTLSDSSFMPLPLLQAAGPDWRLYIAVKDRGSGNVVSTCPASS